MSAIIITTPPAGGLFGPQVDQAALDPAIVTQFEAIEDAVERVVFRRANLPAITRAARAQAEAERHHTTPQS